MSSVIQPTVLVHGGTGNMPDSCVQNKLDGVRKAAKEGYRVLLGSGNVLDAVVKAVEVMEDDEAFNAGRGSVLNIEGEVEMEALICEGKNLSAGSVTLVRNIAHPIALARLVMEKTPHTVLGGEGVNEFIDKMGIPRVPDEYLITQTAIDALEEFRKHRRGSNRIETGHTGSVGTVGCVAINSSGHLASATSTGGIIGKYRGRIGDVPQLGSGGYADDEVGAVSTTGYGESIMKYNLAHRILSAMSTGKSAQIATKDSCEGMTKRVGETAGAITLSSQGDVGVSFTSHQMCWAYQLGNQLHYGIDPGQHLIDEL